MDQNNQPPVSTPPVPSVSTTDDAMYTTQSQTPSDDSAIPQPSEDLVTSSVPQPTSLDNSSAPAVPIVADMTDNVSSIDQDSEEGMDDEEDESHDYIENMGGSLVDLLEQVNTSEDLVATLAKEMHLEHDATQTILENFLDKIHKGTITKEELALALTAPILEEPSLE